MSSKLPAMQRFNMAFSSIMETYHRFAVKFQMSDMEYNILDILMRNPDGCAQSELAYWTGCPRQTVSSACARLRRQGILSSAPGKGQRRILQLTAKGHRQAAETVGRVEKIEDEIFEAWTVQEREDFIRLNEKYMRCLQERERSFQPAAGRAESKGEDHGD